MTNKRLSILICSLTLTLGACNNNTESLNTGSESQAETIGAPLGTDTASKTLSCGTSDEMAKFYAKHPEAYDEAQAAEVMSAEAEEAFRKHLAAAKNTQNANKGLAANPTYVIPVVFHVFGTNFNGKTVTDAIIENALLLTNEDFQGEAIDWNEVISQFAGVKDTLSIEFRLAKIDPNGNPTTGIKYYPARSGFGNGSGYDSQIQSYAWDNYKYMNVYIQNDLYNDGTTTNSGVAWYPSTSMSNNNTARVVYNGAYLGSNTSENFRSVLTHEFGHWLNLIHTFEGGCSSANVNYCSSTGDQICDTPQMDNSGIQGYNCLNEMTNWQNFMHYADQYANFTQDQVARMINALHGSARNTLWSASNLAATGTSGSSNPPAGPQALSNGSTESGVAAATGAYAKFYIDVPSGASNLSVVIGGGTGDADLYVRRGAEPTDSTYDCRPYKGGNSETCSFSSPNSGRWYINLKGYNAFSGVNLTATYTSGGSSSGGSSSGGSSSGGSSSGGSSSGGSLVDACASESPQTASGLSDGDAICVPNGSSSSSIQYYWIYVPSGTSSMLIRSDHGSGNGNVYYKASTWATVSSYDQRSNNSGNTESITINNPASGYRYISVVGSQSGVTLKVDLQ